jgi:hypothetical protein
MKEGLLGGIDGGRRCAEANFGQGGWRRSVAGVVVWGAWDLACWKNGLGGWEGRGKLCSWWEAF